MAGYACKDADLPRKALRHSNCLFALAVVSSAYHSRLCRRGTGDLDCPACHFLRSFRGGWITPNTFQSNCERQSRAVESFSDRFYSPGVKAIFGLAIIVLTVVACRGPGGPMERAGRTVDDAVYDVGTGIKKAGQEVQEAAR